MIDPEKKKELKVRLSEEEWEVIRDVIHERRSSQQEALYEGLQLWLKAGANSREEIHVERQQSKQVSDFMDFMENSHPQLQRVVKQLIADFIKTRPEPAREAEPNRPAAHPRANITLPARDKRKAV